MTLPSIRARLALFLAGALTCGMAVTLGATYGAVRTQLGRTFDLELKQVAQAVHVQEDWLKLGRVRIARPGFSFAVRAYDASGRVYFETVFPTLPPDVLQAFKEGYYFVDSTEGRWRVYTYVSQEGIVQAGQPVATRDALARELSFRAITPFLWLIPFVTLAVVFGLNRALAPLRTTSERVAQRDASLLEPLPTAGVPKEMLPLVEQINALLVRLSRALEGQRNFLADVAHELRTPVAVITLQAQLAEWAATASERESAFAELGRGVERAGRLVQQLLDYARLAPGVNQEASEPVDLASLAREAVGNFAAKAEALGVDLGADAPDACIVNASESQLRSMIANLIDNALRYTPINGFVTVTVRRRGERAELEVEDNGPGIPAHERERVFYRFHRVAGDRTLGHGLGLSIVKAIVEHHEGILVLEDANPGAKDRGLRVIIRLALATPPENARENRSSAARALAVER